MEQSFADLLRDAFSEASVPSFPDADLDFENLNCDKKDGALHQEAAGPTAVLSHMQPTDENVDKEQSDDKIDEEDFRSVGVTSMGETPEEDSTSSEGASEQEDSVSGDDEEDKEEDMGTGEKPGDLSVRCGNEFCNSNKEDRIFPEGQALAPEGAENPQVRDEEQGESESDEEVSYFEKVPERGSEMMTKGDWIEEEEQEREKEKQEDSSDSEREGMKVEHEENVLARCFEQVVEKPCRGGPEKASLEFPELSGQNLQDLITEVDSEDYLEKVKEFLGEEHQEAGESFADYPSDFSSCEDRGISEESDHQSNTLAGASANSGSIAKQGRCLEIAMADAAWTGRAEDTDEEGDEYLYSINLEVDADHFRSWDEASEERVKGRLGIECVFEDAAITGCDGGETGGGDSYSSSDDEEDVGIYMQQEQHRIEAFYQFYDDSDGGNEREGRQIKVQFCTNPLSQVIHYETDSSDRDSLSSSTDMEEDLSSAETSEELKELDDAMQMILSCDPPHTQLPEDEPNLSKIPPSARKDKCLKTLALTLKMGAVITMGLLMFWWSF